MMEKVNFDFSKLKGLIVEKYGNVSNFSDVVNISDSALSKKLNNENIFTPTQLYAIANALEIQDSDIRMYFFTPKD